MRIKYNIFANNENYLHGMHYPHGALVCRKSTMEYIWKVAYYEMNQTCEYKFRNPFQVSAFIAHIADIMTGNFVPSSGKGYNTGIQIDDTNRLCKTMATGEYYMYCFDDMEFTEEQHKKIDKELCDIYEKRFPDKSSFEL